MHYAVGLRPAMLQICRKNRGRNAMNGRSAPRLRSAYFIYLSSHHFLYNYFFQKQAYIDPHVINFHRYLIQMTLGMKFPLLLEGYPTSSLLSLSTKLPTKIHRFPLKSQEDRHVKSCEIFGKKHIIDEKF